MTYATDQADAKALLADAGQPVTLTAPASGAYDPTTGTVGTGGATPVSTIGVVLPMSTGLKHMAGTDIQAGDQRLLLPGDIAQPKVDTKVLIGTVTYVIKDVSPLNPAGTALLFECIIRGGQ